MRRVVVTEANIYFFNHAHYDAFTNVGGKEVTLNKNNEAFEEFLTHINDPKIP